MSARREKRQRKLEDKVTYMEGRVRELERRLLMLEELAASPTMILSTGEDRPRRRGVLASLLLWMRGRKAEN